MKIPLVIHKQWKVRSQVNGMKQWLRKWIHLKKNRTSELVRKPDGTKVMGYKWIYKKVGIPGVEPKRFKAHLVAKEYSQREGIDYKEIFFPVVRHISIRMLLAMTAAGDYELEQMDVKMTFLHWNVDEKILMEQPKGFKTKEKDRNTTCVCLRSHYMAWNKHPDNGIIVLLV